MTIGLITKLAKFADKLINDAGIRAELAAYGGVNKVKGARKVVNLRDYCTGNSV